MQSSYKAQRLRHRVTVHMLPPGAALRILHAAISIPPK
ncbi:hypothetical protein R2A130_0326 [Ahrensia sp. R2A130]|nr:hypothetical protein R2A130_0326 [Ahrensia sp. R2A130]